MASGPGVWAYAVSFWPQLTQACQWSVLLLFQPLPKEWVVVRVAPDKGHLLETRILGGVKYLLIRADESVEVNGVVINIKEED